MSACPACRAELLEGARFCPACGTRLETAGPEATERKVVTTLFADLVGFTALGERHDPEDIDAALRGFYALARKIIERFGGTVEKYIGDAVVGLFGVPLAREDDAERAVRAALELVARLHELPPVGDDRLQVRAAVNTGPALVRLAARPETGEGVLVGDAVNTCARLLSEARSMSVVAGERTHALTERTIAYRPAGDLQVRGKQQRVQAWVATGQVARRGVDLSQTYGAPLVGREVELGILKGLLARAEASSTPQLALVTGEAGVGKTRLAVELARWIDREPERIVVWRQGRCLPYGEASAFQPLSDVVRGHAGIIDADDDAAVTEKVMRAVAGVPDADWIAERLRALLGLAAPVSEQAENFAAWARFLELVARPHPAVVFLDDLQWAEQGLVDFISHLLDDGCSAPLLLFGAARPELLDRQPEFARHLGPATGDASLVTRIDLASLPPSDTRRLVAELAFDVATDVATVIVERSGGNPFYLEELVRLVHQRSESGTPDWFQFESLPATLQALLTARLDALDAEHKAVLADAAVAGQSFPVDLVVDMGGRERGRVLRVLADLAAREFLRAAPGDLGVDEQYVFWHALTRDAAYSQLSRRARAEKHAAAADWIERQHEDRLRELADALADHRLAASELADASGLGDLADRQRAGAVKALLLAGDQVLGLDARAAEARYAKAAGLVRAEDPERGRVLHKWATALMQCADFDACLRVFREAFVVLEEQGDLASAALTAADFSTALELTGDSEGAIALLRTWGARIEEGGPSPHLLRVLDRWLGMCQVTGDLAEATVVSERLVAVARRLGREEPLEVTLFRGYRRCLAGDRGGLADYETGLERALHEEDARQIGVIYYNYTSDLAMFDGPTASLRLRRRGLRLCEQRHSHAICQSLRYGIAHDAHLSGAWTAALAEIRILEPLLEETGSLGELAYLRALKVQLFCDIGRAEEVAAHRDELSALSYGPAETALRLWTMVAGATLATAVGERKITLKLLRDCFDLRNLANEIEFDWSIARVARLAARAGDHDLIARVRDWAESGRPLSQVNGSATKAVAEESSERFREARRHYGDAAERWSDLGVPYEAGLARLGAGRCDLALKRPGPATAALREARSIFVRLGAQPALTECEALLAECRAAETQRRPASGAPGGRR